MDRILEANKQLCSAKTPIAVREFFTIDLSTIEAVEESGKKLYRAKVSHADQINQNRRIYPTEVWKDNIERLKPQLASGMLAGAMDHESYFSAGNLGETCIIWRDLSLADDGAVYGKFEVIKGHSKGEDLQAQINAGLAIGFSTAGYGTSHEPGESERKKYGLTDSQYAVVMDPNYVLKKIDAVDDPSCADARLASKESADNSADETKETTVKDLKELKDKFPAVFALHEAAITSAVDAAIKPHKDRAEATVGLLNKIAPELKNIEGVNVEKREVLPAETETRIQKISGDLETAKNDLKKANDEKAELQGKLDTAAAEKADAERKTKAIAKLDSVLAAPEYAKVAKAIKKAAESKLADKSFDDAAVEAFVKDKADEYAALGPIGDLKEGLDGKDTVEEDVDESDDDQSTDENSLEIPAALEAYGKAGTSKKKK